MRTSVGRGQLRLTSDKRFISVLLLVLVVKRAFEGYELTQFAFAARAQPMTGPLTLPTAHILFARPIHLPLSRKVTRSVYDDIRECDGPATTRPLNTSTHKKHGDVSCSTSQRRSDSEKSESD